MLITKLAEAIEALGKEAGGYSDEIQLLRLLSIQPERPIYLERIYFLLVVTL